MTILPHDIKSSQTRADSTITCHKLAHNIVYYTWNICSFHPEGAHHACPDPIPEGPIPNIQSPLPPPSSTLRIRGGVR